MEAMQENNGRVEASGGDERKKFGYGFYSLEPALPIHRARLESPVVVIEKKNVQLPFFGTYTFNLSCKTLESPTRTPK